MDRVPDTTTFSMCDVKNVVTSVPLNLTDAITTACDTWWDKNYCGSKNSLLNFRNYGVPSILLYGAAYNWYAASNTCLGRNGWCVPTNDEWVTLGTSLPSTSYQAPNSSSEKVYGASKQMKSVGNYVDGTGLWCKAASSANEGTNSSGMNIKPGGIVSNTGVYSGERDYADFWSRSQNPSGATLGMYWNFGYNGSDMYRGVLYYCKNYGFSVRLVRFSGSSTSYVDYEGNTYSAATMDDGRVWMTENLRTQYYCDGTLIPRYTGTTWQNTTNGAIYGIAPVITLSGASNVSLAQYGTYVESGATAMDAVDGNITPNIVITGSVNTSIIGTYYKCYNVMNSMSIPAPQVKRTINVV